MQVHDKLMAPGPARAELCKKLSGGLAKLGWTRPSSPEGPAWGARRSRRRSRPRGRYRRRARSGRWPVPCSCPWIACWSFSSRPRRSVERRFPGPDLTHRPGRASRSRSGSRTLLRSIPPDLPQTAHNLLRPNSGHCPPTCTGRTMRCWRRPWNRRRQDTAGWWTGSAPLRQARRGPAGKPCNCLVAFREAAGD